MKKDHSRLRTVLVNQELSEQTYEGLCMNCRNRKTCVFPKAKDGVLYCNEYE